MSTSKFKVCFQVMGRGTDSNNIGHGIVEAEDAEQAVEFARSDLMAGKWTDIDTSCSGVNEDDDEQEDDDGDPLYNYQVDWSATGAHGRYHGTGGPYAHDQDEALRLLMKDLEEGGFMDFEDEPYAEEI